MIEAPQIFTTEKEIPKHGTRIDDSEHWLKEIFLRDHPAAKNDFSKFTVEWESFRVSTPNRCWVYYPWCDKTVVLPEEETYLSLRTMRNRNIINQEEQNRYRQAIVGVAGLSVGSAVLSALVFSGGPKRIKLADPDTVEISNLNRLRATVLDLGQNKAAVAARNVWEVDPFIELEVWDKGITRETLADFLTKPRLDVFIDEIDSIDLKIATRFICQLAKLPVVMATDNGDGIILDIERFDLEPSRPIFHGLLGDGIKPEDFAKLGFRDWLQLATKIVGPEYLPDRMQKIFLEIGSSIIAIPQLGPSAMMAGAAAAFAVRYITTGLDLPSGRYLINFEERILPGYNSPGQQAAREEKTSNFKQSFGKPAK